MKIEKYKERTDITNGYLYYYYNQNGRYIRHGFYNDYDRVVGYIYQNNFKGFWLQNNKFLF